MKIQKASEEDKKLIGELLSIKRLINELYPIGIVSIVSDTYDFWRVVERILPRLKKDIMKRDGRVVIRPSGYYLRSSYKSSLPHCNEGRQVLL